MKLLRCHIENFGVLSDFDYEFSPGLTVICKENGFGKSTLAAFVKAMFYGMPRKGARNNVDNERKRYDPWQGGQYGGFLEFEYQGISYRVTRYFGKTASKDTISVIDISNRKDVTSSFDKLGEKLFQLDADSFSRSTYMPQLLLRDMEATTSIHTKLSNLVENTNDLNNYDTAEASLRQFRRKLKYLRGSGGMIDDKERDYNALEEKREEAEKEKPRLLEVSEEIDRLDAEKEIKTEAVLNLREKIRVATAQKMLRMRRDQLDALRGKVDKQKQALRELDDKYPAGYPTSEEIKTQRDNLTNAQQAAQRLETNVLSDEDREVVEREQAIFADIDKTAQDIDACDQWCAELVKVSAKLTSQMLPEESQRLDELSKQFEKGAPTEAELQDNLTAADEMNAAQTRLSQLVMSTESREKLEQLKNLFTNGIPDNDMLSACEKSQRDQEMLLERRKSCVLSEKDQEDFQSLQRTFAAGVPSKQEIQDRQNDWRRIVELTSIKNTKTARIEEQAAPKQAASKVPFLCGGIGSVLLMIGIVCFVVNLSVPGALLLVAGFIGLLAAFWLHTRHMVNSNARSASVITESAITDAENQELNDRKRTLNDFLVRFYPDASDPENELIQLVLDAEKFTSLTENKVMLEDKQRQLDQEIEKNAQELRDAFERYYPGEPYRDTVWQELRDSCLIYESLKSQMKDIIQERADLSEKSEAYRGQIINLLRRYYPDAMPENLREGVRDLASDVEDFADLSRKNQMMMDEHAVYQEQEAALTEKIQKTLANYEAFDLQCSLSECLQKLRRRVENYKVSSERKAHFIHEQKEATAQKELVEQSIRDFLQEYQLSGDTPAKLIEHADEDIRSYTATNESLREAEEELRGFLADNPEIEQRQTVEIENLSDPEVLQTAEKATQKEIDEIEDDLRKLRQERDSLRRTVENIPVWDDEMARLESERQSLEKKCAQIDQTLDLLNQAKDNLANSYVGKVERGFEQYASSLLEGQLGHVMLDKDLKLSIDEKGAAREVGSFSVGMVDSIQLCMRLSLVDALFIKEKPFLILDDPFVNLDDEHTKRALEMLNKISQDYQVIYLVCNSSRS